MNPIFIELIKKILDAFLVEAPRQTALLIWKVVTILITEYWLGIVIVLSALLVIQTFKAMLGYWASLTSLLYNIFYFGALLIIGYIFGPEVFVTNFFTFFTALILYPVCYFLVGLILKTIKIIN